MVIDPPEHRAPSLEPTQPLSGPADMTAALTDIENEAFGKTDLKREETIPWSKSSGNSATEDTSQGSDQGQWSR